jgi:ribonucleoside-diphosphate reductase beta chain
MLAISQVEVESVKTFWSNIGEWLGKPEIAMVGTTFGENEITHFEAYSMLLEKLGFNEEFERLLENEVIADRINYLSKYLRGSGDNVQEFNTLKLALFSLFVENVSLFGQFLVIKSFNKKKKKLKSIDNVVLATQKDELCHAQFGVELLRIIKSENPDWFNEAFYVKIERACKKAFEAECRIIDWIFEQGDLDFLTAFDVKEFLKRRFNSSLEDIGASKIFTDIDEASREKTKWFDEEIIAYIRNDFFDTKSTNYNKKIVTRKDIKNAVKRFRKEYGMV